MKHDNPLSMAAEAMHGHGAEDASFGDMSAGDTEHYILATVSGMIMRNLGEYDIAALLTRENGGAECICLIRTDTDGNVRLMHAALTRFAEQAAKVRADYAAREATYTSAQTADLYN
jgi:hypothetical protein